MTSYLILLLISCVKASSIWFEEFENERYREEKELSGATTLRVMTFNTYRCGIYVDEGLPKIVKHMNRVKADIVLLQEINYENTECFNNLTDHLGSAWQCVMREGSFPDDAVCTTHQILKDTYSQTESAAGVKVRIPVVSADNQQSSYLNFSVWAGHFDWRNWAPDAACNKLTDDISTFYAGEMDVGRSLSGRVSDIKFLLANEQFAEALCHGDTEPLILGADFNTPSHLDWGENTKHLHCGWAVPLPGTKLLHDAGLVDSYRHLYPDPLTHPGLSWSPINKYEQDWGYTIPTTQDRIDIILYKSSLLTPVKSSEYYGDQPLNLIPYNQHNDWPSDHAAFVTDFRVTL